MKHTMEIPRIKPRLESPYRTGQFALTDTEYQKLCEGCWSVVDETLLKFAVATGMRRSDVVRVQIQNINLESGAVTYNEKKKHDRIRTIYIGEKMRTQLRKYLKTVPKSQKLLFDFCDRTAYNKLYTLCIMSGVAHRPFHSLRSTCIKRCQKAGWTPEEVCELTGDTLRTIQQHYSVPSIAEMQETATKKEIV